VKNCFQRIAYPFNLFVFLLILQPEVDVGDVGVGKQICGKRRHYGGIGLPEFPYKLPVAERKSGNARGLASFAFLPVAAVAAIHPVPPFAVIGISFGH
jgi:hypothetical protein